MKLCDDQLDALCECALNAATSAGRYVARTRPSNVEHKGTAGSLASQVVTEVDRHSQAIILDVLGPTLDRYDLALLTEESPDDGSRLHKDYFWCIDPIDGTLCYIEDQPGYAISIALISRRGVPHIGVVYDPVADLLYSAIRGRGATRNGQPWRPTLKREKEPLRVFTDRSEADGPFFQSSVQSLGATVERHGGGVLNAIWCLEHAPACYFKFAKPHTGGGCFWDFAATACIYAEVGAWATDVSGARFDFNRTETVHLNHCGVLFATDSELAVRVINAATTSSG